MILFNKYKKLQKPVLFVTILIIILSTGEGVLFSARYFEQDPRIELAKWGYNNLNSNETVCTEPYDIGTIPFDDKFNGKIKILELYDAEGKYKNFKTLDAIVQKCDYIIIPSNRIYPSRFRLPEKFPVSYEYYSKLNDGTLGFKYLISIDKNSGIYSKKPDLSAINYFYPDETFNVFDNPTIIVYEKI